MPCNHPSELQAGQEKRVGQHAISHLCDWQLCGQDVTNYIRFQRQFREPINPAAHFIGIFPRFKGERTIFRVKIASIVGNDCCAAGGTSFQL
jgi:hypothetical protein